MSARKGHVTATDLADAAAPKCSCAAEIERLRTTLQMLISSGGTSSMVRAIAMNTIEAGTGDAWLAGVLDGEWCAECRAPAAVRIDTRLDDGTQQQAYACDEHELRVRCGLVRSTVTKEKSE